MRRLLLAIVVTLMGANLLSACGDDDDGGDTTAPAATSSESGKGAEKVKLIARDYAFDLPAEIRGGLVEFAYTNEGKEPHFAGLAKPAPGKSIEDVKAVFTSPPPDGPPQGPPPFQEVGIMPNADPGAGATATVNLEPGTYVLFCLIPSPDGVSHAAKGMITEVTVTEGPEGPLPESDATIVGTDFAFDKTPALEAGTNVVQFRNDGKQLHEINLVELAPGKKAENVVAWFRRREGPPPMRALSGVATEPGSEATAKLEIESGRTYAFVCAIPDVLGDFTPHIVKGMVTEDFKVS